MVIRCGGHHERVCLLSCNCQAFSIGSQIARVIAKYSSFFPSCRSPRDWMPMNPRCCAPCCSVLMRMVPWTSSCPHWVLRRLIGQKSNRWKRICLPPWMMRPSAALWAQIAWMRSMASGQTKQLSSKAAPAAGTKSPTEENSVKIDFAKMKIPSDVQSIEDWGTTIMAEGKMAPRQMSYAELAPSLSSCHEVWWGFWAYWIQPGPQDRLIDLWMEPNLWKMWWMKQACYGDGKRTVPCTTIWKWYHANHHRRTCLSILDYDRCEIHRCLSTTLVTSHRLHVQGTFGWRIQKDEPERSHGWESWVSALLYIIYKYSHIYIYIYIAIYILLYI